MTRKHFEALALALKGSKPIAEPGTFDEGAWNQWRADVRAVAGVIWLSQHFDLGRFYAACGYEIEGVKS